VQLSLHPTTAEQNFRGYEPTRSKCDGLAASLSQTKEVCTGERLHVFEELDFSEILFLVIIIYIINN
jgi:hypothetical protein